MIIVVTLYSGSLVSFLTFPIIEPSIESIDELVAMENAAADATWGLLSGRYYSKSFKAQRRHFLTFMFYL